MLSCSRILAGLVSALILSGAAPAGALVLNPGDILTIESIPGGPPPLSVLLRVDPVTGASEIISDPNHGVGPDLTLIGNAESAIAIEASGQILVTAVLPAPSDEVVILRIDPATGDRTVVAGNGVGGTGFTPLLTAIAVVPSSVAVASTLQDWGSRCSSDSSSVYCTYGAGSATLNRAGSNIGADIAIGVNTSHSGVRCC